MQTKCHKCDRLITNNNLKKHIKSCGLNKKVYIKLDNSWKVGDNQYKCPYCNKIYKSGITTHILRKHLKPELYKIKHGDPWNKGLTKETDERVRKIGETFSKYRSGVNSPWYGKHHKEETKLKISKKLSQNNKGGRCKWFQYEKKNGIIYNLQGTWEVRFAKVLDIIDEDWIKIGIGKHEHTFKWKDQENKDHSYTPDFYSPKLNKYFEVKGYWWGNDKFKMEQILNQSSNIKIELIMKNDLNNYEKLLL